MQDAFWDLFTCVEPIASALATNPGAFLYAAGGLPYSFQNGLAMIPSASSLPLPEGFAFATLPQMVSDQM